MTDKQRIPAKANGIGEQSDAIVVSFDARWHSHLQAKDFSIVLRKRIPRSATFTWLYFHINNPISAICGRARIRRTAIAKKRDAVRMARLAQLLPAEIENYIGNDPEIPYYELGSFELVRQPVNTSELSRNLVYHPPQSFFIVSRAAKLTIDEMAGF